MNKNNGCLVSREYLERLDAEVFGNVKPREKKRRASRKCFYQIRPIKFTGNWGEWRQGYYAPARFIEKDGELGGALEVFSDSYQYVDPTGAEVFAVYRGKWYPLTLPTAAIVEAEYVEETTNTKAIVQLTPKIEVVNTHNDAYEETTENGGTSYSQTVEVVAGQIIRLVVEYKTETIKDFQKTTQEIERGRVYR